MEVNINPITESDYQEVYRFQMQYLDKESYEDFVSRAEQFPDLYLVARLEEKLVGIAYGHPFEKDSSTVNLQGIAVDLDEDTGVARKGIGTQLLQRFESVAKSKGFKKVGLGSADDMKVENFYLKNGYRPIEVVAKDKDGAEYARVAVGNTEAAKKEKERLREKYDPKEVILIFEKEL